MKPDFICIGAQKSGTTWLYRRLKSHPEFSMLPIKEIHYFDRSKKYPAPNTLSETRLIDRLKIPGYSKKALRPIVDSLKSGKTNRALWWARYGFRNYSDKWYLSLFKSEKGISGDISPSYSVLDDAGVFRIRVVAPHAKIVFMLRNPIERAWSQYRYREKFGHEVDCQNIEVFKDFVNSSNQELRSNYIRTIDTFLKHFQPSSMILAFYDAIVENPKLLLSEILKHLGAKDTSFSKDLLRVENRSRHVEIPKEYHQYLVEKYREDIKHLAQRYGSYAKEWHSAIARSDNVKTNQASILSPVIHLENRT